MIKLNNGRELDFSVSARLQRVLILANLKQDLIVRILKARVTNARQPRVSGYLLQGRATHIPASGGFSFLSPGEARSEYCAND